MKIVENFKEKELVDYKAGDIVKGWSGNYYLIIRKDGKYNLVSLKSYNVLKDTEKDSITELLNSFSRDTEHTHVKAENVTLTLEV